MPETCDCAAADRLDRVRALASGWGSTAVRLAEIDQFLAELDVVLYGEA